MAAETLLTILIYDLQHALPQQPGQPVDAGHIVRALETATKLYEIMHDTYPISSDIPPKDVVKTEQLNPIKKIAETQNILIQFQPSAVRNASNYKEIVKNEVNVRLLEAEHRLTKMQTAPHDPREAAQTQHTIDLLRQLKEFAGTSALTSSLIDVDAFDTRDKSTKDYTSKMDDFMRTLVTTHTFMFQARYLERIMTKLSLILLDDANELSVVSLYKNITLGLSDVERYIMSQMSVDRKAKFITEVTNILSDYDSKVNQVPNQDTRNMYAFETKNKLVILVCKFLGLNYIERVHTKIYNMMSEILNTLTSRDFKPLYTRSTGNYIRQPKDTYEMFKVLSDSFATQHYLDNGVATEMAAFRNAMRVLQSNFSFTVGAELEAPPVRAQAENVILGGIF